MKIRKFIQKHPGESNQRAVRFYDAAHDPITIE